MDQIDVWTVRGRVATAVRSVREDLARLAVDSEELTEAMAEAERLGVCDMKLAVSGTDPIWRSVQ